MARLRNFLATSGRINLARLSLREFPAFSFVLLLWALGNAILPNAVLLAMGRVVAAAVAQATTSHRSMLDGSVTVDLAVFAALSAGMFCLVPTQRALAAYSRTKLTSLMQRRLIAAVSQPVGIAHLEDEATLDRISLAQGALMSYNPAEAPVALASATGVRLQGVVACMIVGDFRWWLGLALFVFWNAVRRPLMGAVRQRIRTFGGEASIMRRATYFENLATRPEGAKELRVFGLGNWVVDRLRQSWESGTAVAGKQYAAIFSTVWKFCPILLGLYLVVCLVMAHVAHQHVVSSTIAVTLTVLPLTSYVGQYTADTGGIDWMISTLPPIDSLESELHERAVEQRGERPVPPEAPRASIRFENVGFGYRPDTELVFSHLDLEIRARHSTAIVGVNGAGKTTLVKLLGRLHDPSSGRITVDGTDLRDFDPVQWQHKLAVVFQDFNHYPLSARDNVSLGAAQDDAALADLDAAAARAGLSGIVGELSRGWETILSKEFAGGTDLSGGQWQRFALARALFAARRGASVLVLDEPTSMLDVRAEAEFYDRFLSITEGLTTVVISHRFATVRLADTIIVLDGGEVVEQGSHRELVAAGGRYAEMYAVQASRFTEDTEAEEEAG